MLSVARTTGFRSRQSLAFLAMSLVMSSIPRAAAADAPIEIIGVSSPSRDAKSQTVDTAAEKAGTPTLVELPDGLKYAPEALVLGQGYGSEVEPNGTAVAATPLSGTNVVVRGNIFPTGDVDFYSFTATAGDRVYAATMTSASASATNGRLTLLRFRRHDDRRVRRRQRHLRRHLLLDRRPHDPDDGTYFLRVNDFTAGTHFERPYELHFRVQSGAPTPEVEPNDTPATANPLPANGWVSGTRNPAARPPPSRTGFYSLTLNAGDTRVPVARRRSGARRRVLERSARLRASSATPATRSWWSTTPEPATYADPEHPSEAMFLTVEDGRHLLRVRRLGVGGGRRTDGDLPPERQRASGDRRGRQLHDLHQHERAADHRPGHRPRQLDHHRARQPADRRPRRDDRAEPRVDERPRRAPALAGGQRQRLCSPTSAPALTVGGQTQMDITFDDEAAHLRRPSIGPRGAPAQARAAPTASAGSTARTPAGPGRSTCVTTRRRRTAARLTAWSIRICEAPPPPSCPPGFAPHDRVLHRLRGRRRRLHALAAPRTSGSCGLPATRRDHDGEPGRGVHHLQQRRELLEDRPRQHLQRLREQPPGSAVAEHQPRRPVGAGGRHLGAALPDRERNLRPPFVDLQQVGRRHAGAALRMARRDDDGRARRSAAR